MSPKSPKNFIELYFLRIEMIAPSELNQRLKMCPHFFETFKTE